ncbi:hypothetical protein [Putridiphycobacter roseus]|nr:hypothetical protein [Putridiphycobacter roseus]
MSPIFPIAIIVLYVLFAALTIALLVYLVIRRFKLKEEETFEKREN